MPQHWWVIFYGDGSKFSSRDGSPDQAPARNVQVVHQFCRSQGQQRIADCHWYVWQADRWEGLETEDALWDYLMSLGWRRVLFGRRLDREFYHGISAHAHRYCRYQEKREKPPWEPDR